MYVCICKFDKMTKPFTYFAVFDLIRMRIKCLVKHTTRLLQSLSIRVRVMYLIKCLNQIYRLCACNCICGWDSH